MKMAFPISSYIKRNKTTNNYSETINNKNIAYQQSMECSQIYSLTQIHKLRREKRIK